MRTLSALALLAACLSASTRLCNAGHSATEERILDFLADYVRFYNIPRVQMLLEKAVAPWPGVGGALFRILSAAGVPAGVIPDSRVLRSAPPFTAGLLLLPYHPLSRDVTYQLLQEQNLTSSRVLVLGEEAAVEALVRNLSLPLSNLVQLGGTWEKGVKVWEQYRVAPHMPLMVHLVAIWTRARTPPGRVTRELVHDSVREVAGRGFFVGVAGEVATRRRDLYGLRLKCMAESWIPMSIVDEDEAGRMHFSGIFSEVVKALQGLLNFTCSWSRPKDRLWGARSPNGEWTGMVREVMAGRADLIGGLIILSSRAEVIDYSIAIQQTWNMIVVRKPSSKDMTWTSYTKEFTPWAWAGVGVLTALAPLAFFYLARSSPKEVQEVALGDSFLLMMGMMTQQGSEMRVSSTSCRIIFFAMFVSAQLIVMHYSSFLISMLSVSNNILPFKNLEELHRTGDYQLGIWKGSFTEDTFRHSDIPLYKAVWRDMVEGRPGSLTYNPDGVARVLEGKYAYIMTQQEFQYSYSDDPRLVTLPDKAGIFYMALGLRKNSPLKPIIDEQITRLRSSGILNLFEIKNSKQALAFSRTNAPSLSLQNVGAAFIILASGTVMALCFLLAETIYTKYARPPPRPRPKEEWSIASKSAWSTSRPHGFVSQRTKTAVAGKGVARAHRIRTVARSTSSPVAFPKATEQQRLAHRQMKK